MVANDLLHKPQWTYLRFVDVRDGMPACADDNVKFFNEHRVSMGIVLCSAVIVVIKRS